MSFKLRLLYQLKLHHIIAPSYFLMKNSGTALVKKKWMHTDLMGLGKLSNFLIARKQLDPDGL
jgi:hypothetical protein